MPDQGGFSMGDKRSPFHKWFVGEISNMATHGIMGAHYLSRMAREVEIPKGHDEIMAAWEVSVHRLNLGKTTIDDRFRKSILEQKAEAKARAEAKKVVGGQSQTVEFSDP